MKFFKLTPILFFTLLFWVGLFSVTQATDVTDDITVNIITTPTVSTVSASSITQISAYSGGNVTSDGGATVTARGVVWGNSSNPTPTITSYTGKTSNGSGTGAYTSSLTSLISGNTYYVRAYATNSIGTSYGEILSFVTIPPIPTPTATPSTCSSTSSTSIINVSWTSSTGATSYTLKDGATVIYTGSSTSYSHTGLTAGSSHSYSVSASNLSGSSPSSTAISATAPSWCTHTVTFNGNGSTGGSTATQTFGEGEIKNLNANGFTKTNYTFSGWATSLTNATNGVVAYANQASYTMGTSNVNLYAVWAPITHTVTFNGNGNTGGSTATQTIAQGATANLNANGFTKTNYTFAGWDTNSSGLTVVYTNQALYTMGTSNVNLYAVWTPITHTVTFNGNGNTGGSTATQTINQGATANLNANGFTKTGYTFSGWATSSTGSVVYTDQASYTMSTSNVTLYAKWSIIVTVSVTATTPYTVIPSQTVSFSYSASTNTGSYNCRLLDYAYSGLTSYSTSNPINYAAPTTVGQYGYYVQCRNATYTTITATSNQIIVNVVAPNQAPSVYAGLNRSITLPTSSTTDSGATVSDSDGTISSMLWTFRSGPKTPTITSASTLSPTFGSMTIAGTYTFRLTATDDDGASSYDEMYVVVNPVTPITVNLTASPTEITLPTNSVVLSWSTANTPDSCVASGSSNWTGAKASSGGSETVAYVSDGTYTHTLTCSKSGTADVSSTVYVTVNPVPNQAPNAPSITSDASVYYKNILSNFTFTSTDPDGDSILYEIDWNGDSVVDLYLPSIASFVNSGQTLNSNYSWSSVGTYSLKARAKDNSGASNNYSSWATYPVTVLVPPSVPTIITTTNPDTGSVEYNGKVTIFWETTDATSCNLSGNGESLSVAVTNLDPGYTTVPLTSNTVYTLACSGAGGTTYNDVFLTVGEINPTYEEK